MEVNIEKLPVPSISEVLGYLAPGAAALGIVYLAEAYATTVDDRFSAPLHKTAALLGWGTITDGWIPQGLVAVAILLLCYVAGHLIDSVAKLLIDRTLIFKGYGYPYQFLLDLPMAAQRKERALVTRKWRGALRTSYTNRTELAAAVVANVQETPRRSDLSASFYRGFFFWFNLHLLVRWLGFLQATSVGLQNYFWGGLQNYFWCFANVIGVWCVILAIIKFFVGRWIGGLVDDVHDAIGSVKAAGKRRMLVVYRWATIGLHDIVTSPLGKLLNTRRSLDTGFVRAYRRCFRDRFRMRPQTAESNNYWLPFTYLLCHSAPCAQLLARYHQLYRFSRNASVALFAAFSYVMYWYFLNVRALAPSDPWPVPAVLYALLAIYVASLIFLLHYYYLYVCYYSKFLFRAFVMHEWPRIGISPSPLSR